MKTSELAGIALDWAVAKAEGREKTFGHGFGAKFAFYPSSRWSQGGPIIDRERIATEYEDNDSEDENWLAYKSGLVCFYGPTLLIAAMRCFVASKLGDEVNVPKELLE